MSQLAGSVECPQSISGHDQDRRGKCVWCGRQIGRPVPPPPPETFEISDLSLYYSYFWEPDALDGVKP